MATLSDIAKEANVSKMIVSRATNYPEQVALELLALVGEAMIKLDHRPSSTARVLVNNQTSAIKSITLEGIGTTEPYYMNLLFGVARGLEADSYAVQLVTDIDQIQEGNADGYIITGARECNYPIFDGLKKPFIFFGETSSSSDSVNTDNRCSTAVATKYALARDYKNAVFTGIDVKKGFECARERGYLTSMQERNLKPQIFRTGSYSHLAEKLIGKQIERIKPNTCSTCAGDHLTIGVRRALVRLNKKMSEDYGVTGFDGVFLDQATNPQLTTVKQQIFKVSDTLAQLILEKIK